MTTSRAVRLERLVALAESQRRTLADCAEPWRRPLAVADRGIAAVRFVKTHPLFVAGGVLAPQLFQARELGTWLSRGVAAWRMVRRLTGR